MRNLVEYPITIDEVKLALEMAAMQEDGVGGFNSYVLTRIRDLLDERFTPQDFNPPENALKEDTKKSDEYNGTHAYPDEN